MRRSRTWMLLAAVAALVAPLSASALTITAYSFARFHIQPATFAELHLVDLGAVVTTSFVEPVGAFELTGFRGRSVGPARAILPENQLYAPVGIDPAAAARGSFNDISDQDISDFDELDGTLHLMVVPEPGSFALLALGTALLALHRRRR